MSTTLQDRIKTLADKIEGFDQSMVEDVTCENFMTEHEGYYSVIYDGIVYDWIDGSFVVRDKD